MKKNADTTPQRRSTQSQGCIDEWVNTIRRLQHGKSRKERDHWWAHGLELAYDRSGGDIDFVADIIHGLATKRRQPKAVAR